ncbi:MAG: 3'-5' exonuclease [bacterium]|nr:3'-5' exonuclease [bacterium]
MIVVDVETTGTDPHVHGIVSVGAVDLASPERRFYDECRVFEGAHVMEEALGINGFTEKEIHDPSKKTEEQVLRSFIPWAMDTDDHTLAGHNPIFDISMLQTAAKRYGLDWPFPHRSIDSHSVCFAHMIWKGKKPPTEKGRTALNLDSVLKYVGLPPEPRPHNGLQGALRAAEALSRLLYGKGLLPEFEKCPIWGDLPS